MAEGENEVIAAIAREQLIDKLPTLSIKEIEPQGDNELIEFLWLLIRGLIAFKQRIQRRQYKTELAAVESLTEGQKMIYFTQVFESLNFMGDFDKFRYNSFEWEITGTIESYKLIDSHELAEAIKKADESTEEIQYDEKALLTRKLRYIRSHLDQFEIKER